MAILADVKCSPGISELVDVLSFASRLPAELTGLVLGPLQEAVASCITCLASALDELGALAASGQVDAKSREREEALCIALGKVLQAPASRQLCLKRGLGCAEALARCIMRHATQHEIQVNAQWALVQIAGVLKTLEVVQPIFYSAEAVNAFLWTAAEAKEDLTWDAQQMLTSSALRMVQDGGNADTMGRCFELIGARLSASTLSGAGPELGTRHAFAADAVPVLADAIGKWAGVADGRIPFSKATEALFKVCRGSDSDEPCCNPDAQRRLQFVESKHHMLCRVLHQLGPNDREIMSQLLELLTSIYGMPFLLSLLTGQWAGNPGTPPSEHLKWSLLKEFRRLPDYKACEAIDAVPAILRSVGPSPSAELADLVVKTVHGLMECLRTHMQPGADNERRTGAMRCGAEGVMRYILLFQRQKDGRWPTKSAKALRAAALVDPASREALSRSAELKDAAAKRIAGACRRHDGNTYWELEGTLLLSVTIWGVPHVLGILSDALESPTEQLPQQGRQELIQVICRVFTQDDMEPVEALTVLKAILRTKDVLYAKQELPPEIVGPMGGVLGHLCQICAEAQPGIGNIAEEVEAASAVLVQFADGIREVPTRWVASELCWGIREAAASRGGLPAAALARNGAAEKLEPIAERLIQMSEENAKSQDVDHRAVALAETLEALARIQGGSFLPLVATLQRYGKVEAVRAACLNAAANLIDDKLVPRSQQEGEALVAACRDAVGSQDERVRSKAERILGLLASRPGGLVGG